jgi:hypothetical protein
MSERPTVVFVGTYPSTEVAESDFKQLKQMHHEGILGQMDAAIVHKDDAGEVSLHRESSHLFHQLGNGELKDLAATFANGTVNLVIDLDPKDAETIKEYASSATSSRVHRVGDIDAEGWTDPQTDLTHAEWMTAILGGSGYEDGSVGHLGV